MTAERWLPIAGFEGYEVSDFGRVRSFRGRGGRRGALQNTALILKPGLSDGYPLVTLSANGVRANGPVHRLVLEAFVGPCPPGMEACHAPDKTRSNCRLDNLRWDTRVANFADRDRDGTTARGDRNASRLYPGIRRGERNGLAKLSDAAVKLMRWLRAEHEAKLSELSSWFGVSEAVASAVCLRKTWRHVA